MTDTPDRRETLTKLAALTDKRLEGASNTNDFVQLTQVRLSLQTEIDRLDKPEVQVQQQPIHPERN